VLVDGMTTVRVVSDQAGKRVGDCVAVEQGQFANIRLVPESRCAPSARPIGRSVYRPRYAARRCSRRKFEMSTFRPSARSMSGGNQQKAIVAREMDKNPDLLVAVQPTRGLDIGATEYVRWELLEQRKKGAAILLISEDLDEILALSDRIAVIYEGRIMDIVPRAQATPEKLGLLMAGVHPEEGASVVQ